MLGIEQDEYFAFIVGYTPGGAPYGITWQEWFAEDQSGRRERASALLAEPETRGRSKLVKT